MAGLKYEIGREYMEHGEREHARRYFKDAIKLEKTFLPARVGFGETLIGEGKLREAAEMWEKSYLKTGNSIFLYRLENLYLEIGEPGEMIRIYQQALTRQSHDAQLKMALGKLYYRLEMVDDAFELLSTLDSVHDPTGDVSKIMASLYIRKGNTEAALMEVLGDSRPGLPLLNCAACDYHTREWSGRCPACGRWNTLAVMAPRAAGDHSPTKGSDLSPTSSYPGVPAPFEIV